jgi:hypothetical protein
LLVAADSNRHSSAGVRVFEWDGGGKPTDGQPIWFRDELGVEIDYVPYDDGPPWPSDPNDGGPSLMLLNPWRDNALADSWRASDQLGGTPGAGNLRLLQSSAMGVDSGEMQTVWADVVTGAIYRLSYTEDLLDPVWRPAGNVVTAVHDQVLLVDTNWAAATQRFYRVERHFP